MPPLRPWILALAAAAGGCTSSTTQINKTPLGPETRIMPRVEGEATVAGEWTTARGLLRGRLTWRNTCQTVDGQRFTEDEVATTAIDPLPTAIAIAFGIGATAASIWLLADAESYSDKPTCEANDADDTCSSPRDTAYGLGASGALIGGIGVGYGIYTLFQDPTEEILHSEQRFEVEARRPGEVLCGSEPIHGLGLAVTRVGQVLARSTTNDASEVAFAIPPDVTGGLQVVVDAVPPHLVAWVRVGDVLGDVEMAPPAP